jgi:UTP--glucose-1-phosphate uridylyltransferase
MEIAKVIIPAAGLGTRFLPYTKTIPKEMLPLIHKPALQLIIEECASSGITQLVLVTSRGKSVITDHFDYDNRLHEIIQERQHRNLALTELEQLIRTVYISTVRQPEPLGLGHAIWLSRHSIGKEYFGICLPDDIIMGPEPALAQLIRIAHQEKSSVIAVQEVPSNTVSSYGIVAVKKQLSSQLFELSGLVEKPHPHDAPSRLAIVGRYILSSKIFYALEEISSYAHEELQLTDAISRMLAYGERVLAYKLPGTRHDIGTPVGWLKAVMSMAWGDPLYGPPLHMLVGELEERRRRDSSSQRESDGTL